MKNIFNPIYNVIINILAYSLLGVLFSFEFGENGFLTAGIYVSVILFFLYVLYLKNFKQTTKSQHLAFLVVTISTLLLMLVYYAISIKRSPYFLLILSLASVSPLYNFGGYVRFTQVDENTSLLKYILGIITVPFTVFLIYNHYAGTNYKTIYMIVVVAAYYFVLFSLIKIAALVIKEKNLVNNLFTSPEAHKQMTFFLAIVMPLTGLLLNRYGYSYVSQYAKQTGYTYGEANSGIFGDFSHPVFYALTLINGISLLIPMSKYDKLRLPLLFVRSLGYCFIIYMFIVFLPVLPVGVLALFFIVGIYAFVPLAITWWQGKILLADYKALKEKYKKGIVISVFILGFLTPPVLLGASFAYDKNNFDNAISYIDQYNTDTGKKVDINALERTLSSRYADTYRRRLYGSKLKLYYSYKNVPIISGAYKLFVYGNRELGWESRQMLEASFLDSGYYSHYDYGSNLDILDYYNRNKVPVRISGISHDTVYDESIQAYRTWIDIDLRNSRSDVNEYKTVFYIPDGVYVSDYYLYVGDEKKMGLLTDRRAALSIYRKIVLSKLDPGILHYVDDNLLELRVFPFWPNEKRQTGFEVIHKNNFELKIDSRTVKVDVDESFSEFSIPNAVLLSADEVDKLPPLNKELDYNFILDCSESSDTDKLKNDIYLYCSFNGIDDATLYLTTYRFDKYPLKDIHKLEIENEGGFNLNLAVKDIFLNAKPDKIPVIIFVTNNDDYKIIGPKQIKNYTSPESDFYYKLNSDFELIPYSLHTNYVLDPVEKPIIKEAVSYNGIAVINDGTDKLVILNEEIPETTGNQYLDAIALSVESRIDMKNGIMHPVSYIKKSFTSHVLTPATAFIVVETAEQEEALLKLQEKILNEQEAGESDNDLSEPSIVVLTVLVCLFMIFMHIRKRNSVRVR